MQQYIGLGLMSGTSRDGLDMALCRLTEERGHWQYEILAAETVAYDPQRQEQLEGAMALGASALYALDVSLGHWMGLQAADFLKRNNLKADFVASHGHTVHHQPHLGYTCQIGCGHSLHAAVELPVIADFRQLDVSLGGQGAPLVPVGDRLLFGQYDYCLNLGGFANISYEHDKGRHAFDIVPVGQVLNRLAAQEGLIYDDGGRLAASGVVLPAFAERLKAIPYLIKSGPKSLGEEDVLNAYLPLIEKDEATADLLHTYCVFAAGEIARAIMQKKSDDKDSEISVLVTGGGAWNSFLVERIRYVCGNKVALSVPDAELVNFKEAVVFALLGALRLRGQNNTLKSVTGAVRDSCGGVIFGEMPGV